MATGAFDTRSFSTSALSNTAFSFGTDYSFDRQGFSTSAFSENAFRFNLASSSVAECFKPIIRPRRRK